MWLFLSNAFVSIVQPKKDGAINSETHLMVRARFPGDLQQLFPGVRIEIDKGTDYRFRCFVPREKVARLIAQEIENIDYTNFKDSVPDKARHDTYMRVWTVMFNAQEEGRPKRRRRKRFYAPLDSEPRGYSPDDVAFWDFSKERWNVGKPQPLRLVKKP